MQAFEIAYSPDESMMALGWPTGLVEVATVDPNDGSPASTVARSFFHKREITFLAFLNENELLSVDERGRISVCAVDSGALLRHLDLGGAYVRAGLSPSLATLFVFAHDSPHDTNTFAVDVTTFDFSFGPEAADLSVQSRVFGVDDRVAAFYAYHETDLEEDDTWEGDERVDEALIFIDFNSGAIDKRVFDGGPASSISDFPVFAVNAARGIGVRCGFAVPLELSELDGHRFLDIKLEVFDLDTLAPVRAILVGGVPLREDSDELEALVANESRRDEDYREKVSDLFENITSLALTADAEFAWLGVRGGLVRRVRLDGSERSKVIKHGGEPERDTMNLNEVFARNIRNNQTLGISASGSYVAFSNPNEFFRATSLDLDGRGTIELPMRARSEGEAEPPNFLEWVGGDLVVVGTAGGFVFLVDASTGDVLFREQVPYGDHQTAASLSPDQSELILAYAGRASIRVRFRQDDDPEIVELPLPPHTVFADHVRDDLVVLANSNGAVITLEGDTLHAFRNDEDHGEDDDEVDFEDAFDDDELADDELDDSDLDPEEEEEETPEVEIPWQVKNPEGVDPLRLVGNFEGLFVYNDYFEQKQDVYDVAGCSVEGRYHVFVLLEDGDIEIYRLGDSRIEPGFTHTGKWLKSITAAGDTVALYDLESGEVQIFAVSNERLQKRLAFRDDGLRMVALSADGGELFLFNELSGIFSVLTIATGRERAMFTYTGPAVRGMSFEPDSRRATMIEGNGNCLLLDARAGTVFANLRVEASTDGRNVALAGDAVGTVAPADFTIERELTSDAEGLVADEEHSRKADLFSAGPRGEDERESMPGFARAAEQLEPLIEAGDFAAQLGVLDPLLRDFESRDYFSLTGSNRFRTQVGAAFAQRGEANRGIGDAEAAARDFDSAVRFHYYAAYLSRIEQLTYELGQYDDALALVDRVLIDYDAKSSIGLRKSTPLYRAQIYCRTRRGDADGAYRSVRHVLESLVTYLEGEAESVELRPIVEDLEQLSSESELARQLAEVFRSGLMGFPARVPKDPARKAELDAALRRARFFEMNGRQQELVGVLDRVLAPHDGLRYFGASLPNGVKHKLGDFWGLRGQARLALGQARESLADFEKAIEFRDVRRTIDALEVCVFELGDADAVQRLLSSFIECPFNWGSEYWNPFRRFDYAYVLTLAALAERLTGRESNLDRITALYASEIGKVEKRLLERAADRPQRFAAESILHFLRSEA